MGLANEQAAFSLQSLRNFFTRNKDRQKIDNRIVWFKKWIIERQTFKTLSRESKISKDTLQRTFYQLFERAPKVNIYKRENINLRYDATCFKQFCLLCYQDDFDGHVQLIRFSDEFFKAILHTNNE